MIASLRASGFRLAAGCAMATAAAGVLLLALPGAEARRSQGVRASQSAEADLRRREADLKAWQAEAERIQAGEKALDDLMKNMPAEGIDKLQWRLSQRLFQLAKAHEVRLKYVKYGPPGREGAKGSLLEALDVEFAITGLFQDLKAFMLGLEGSKLPFAVAAAKLEESPEGAHLTVTLRAFRQAPEGRHDPGEAP